MQFDPCGFGSVFVSLALGILSFLDPVFRDLWPTISLVKLVTCHDGSRVTSLALSIGSFASWITSVRLGRCLPCNPCLRLSTRSPRGRLTLSTKREGIAPSCQTVERLSRPPYPRKSLYYLRFKATCRTTIPCRSVLCRGTELLAEFSPSAYMTDTQLSRLTGIPGNSNGLFHQPAPTPHHRKPAPAVSQPCRQQARAAGHGQDGGLVTGSPRGWGCCWGCSGGLVEGLKTRLAC